MLCEQTRETLYREVIFGWGTFCTASNKRWETSEQSSGADEQNKQKDTEKRGRRLQKTETVLAINPRLALPCSTEQLIQYANDVSYYPNLAHTFFSLEKRGSKLSAFWPNSCLEGCSASYHARIRGRACYLLYPYTRY